MSKRLVIIDTWSNALDLAMRAQEWGWEVLIYDQPRKDGSIRLAGKGIVPKIIDYDLLRTKYIDYADLIFLPDNTAYLEMLEPYRKLGYPIFGPSPEAAELELDREKGQEAMKAAGLKTIPGIEFHDYDDAAKYVEKHQEYLVSKPSGDANKVLSYVAHDAASLIYMLHRWKTNEKYRNDAKKYGFILQEKKVGAEFACGGWFGPGGWADCWYENLENKKMMNGDLGETTGEMGTVSMYVKNSKLADLALKPMTKKLRELDYVGFIDISGMVDDSGDFWPFEFTVRPGWPTMHNCVATHEGDPVQWMLDLLNGYDTLKVKMNTVCISVVLAIPDFPHSKFTRKEVTGIPVYLNGARENVHLCGVMLGEAPVQVGDKVVTLPCYVTCEDYVAVCTGLGETITGARKSVYSTIKRVKIPNDMFYRTDIGRCRLIKDLPALQKHGFAKGFKP
jgi:phosphoribosylamine--glycine ligase